MARSSNAMGGIGAGLGKFTELRQRLLFVLGALIVYRIGCYIPVPGVNPDAMLQLMEQQEGTIVDMFNMFSGGALSRFSLFALNVIPYISASIVIQLLVQIVPSLKAIQKEGESGRRRITQWSRIGAIPLAVFQAAGIAVALQSQGAGNGLQVVYNPGPGFVITADGRPATMPAKMIMDTPLPMPRSVTCSPSQTRNMVPAVRAITAVRMKPMPGL